MFFNELKNSFAESRQQQQNHPSNIGVAKMGYTKPEQNCLPETTSRFSTPILDCVQAVICV